MQGSRRSTEYDIVKMAKAEADCAGLRDMCGGERSSKGKAAGVGEYRGTHAQQVSKQLEKRLAAIKGNTP